MIDFSEVIDRFATLKTRRVYQMYQNAAFLSKNSQHSRLDVSSPGNEILAMRLAVAKCSVAS